MRARLPWFQPYEDAGAHGSTQDGEICCPLGTCEHCHTSRTIRYADAKAELTNA